MPKPDPSWSGILVAGREARTALGAGARQGLIVGPHVASITRCGGRQ